MILGGPAWDFTLNGWCLPSFSLWFILTLSKIITMDLSQIFAALSPEQQKLFYQGPALQPPEGVVSNFDNPPNRNVEARAIYITSAVVSTIAVAVRLYTRIFIAKRITLRLEDYIVIAAWAILGPWFYYAWGLITTAGFYVHQWNVRYSTLVDFLYNLDCASTIYGVVVGLTKTAILLDWLHLLVPQRTKDMTAWTIYIVIGLNCAYYIAGCLVYLFPCNPRKRFWDQTTPGTCVDVYAVAVAAGVVNLVSDFVMLAIPQKVIWNLHLTRHRKLGISSLFGIGIFACVCGVARLAYNIKLLIHQDDLTYTIAPVELWMVGEMTSGFLILGVPSFPQAIKETKWIQSCLGRVRSPNVGSKSGIRGSTNRSLPSWYKRASSTGNSHSQYTDLDGIALVEGLAPSDDMTTREKMTRR